MQIPKDFLEDSEEKAFSLSHRATIHRNIGKYNAAVIKGKEQFSDLETAKKMAKNRKWQTMENLPELLEEFEKKFTERGGKVFWARNVEEAQDLVLKILYEKNARTVVKSKSMISEEIELNELLETENIEVLETDLGEFIVQLLGQKPYHIVTPAMHLSLKEIADLFTEKFGTPNDFTAEQLTFWVRQHLRPYFRAAQVGITGGNFLIADTGSIVITENEGNARLSATLPRTHIAIVGIEKMLPSIQDLSLFLPLLATHGTGQQLTVYNTIISAARQQYETEGPEDVYVILLDNGRSDMLADTKLRESLYCIRCGACLNACPVYQTIGGHSYNAPYTGPIGSVIMPSIGGMEDFGHLSHASSLCGSCTAVCPININIHELLVYNRNLSRPLATRRERLLWFSWKKIMSSRRLMNTPRWAKKFMLRLFVKKAWGSRRVFPDFPARSFQQLWVNGEV